MLNRSFPTVVRALKKIGIRLEDTARGGVGEPQVQSNKSFRGWELTFSAKREQAVVAKGRGPSGVLPSACMTYSRCEEQSADRELKLSLIAPFHQGLREQEAETRQLRMCRSSEGMCSPCAHGFVCTWGLWGSCFPPWHLPVLGEVKQSLGLRFRQRAFGKGLRGLLFQSEGTGHAGVIHEVPRVLPDLWAHSRAPRAVPKHLCAHAHVKVQKARLCRHGQPQIL